MPVLNSAGTLNGITSPLSVVIVERKVVRASSALLDGEIEVGRDTRR